MAKRIAYAENLKEEFSDMNFKVKYLHSKEGGKITLVK